MDNKKLLRRIFDVHVWAVALAIIGVATAIAAVTMTGYYPAPYGEYNKLRVMTVTNSLGTGEIDVIFDYPAKVGYTGKARHWINIDGDQIIGPGSGFLDPPSLTNPNVGSRLDTLGVNRIFDVQNHNLLVDPTGVSSFTDVNVGRLNVKHIPGDYAGGFCTISRSLTIGSPTTKGALTVQGDTSINGNFTVSGGTKNAAIDTKYGKRLTAAVESTEVRLTDQGKAKLNNGTAKIEIEAIFKETIENTDDYLVTITPMDNCKGMYISETAPDHFIVKELNNGKSNARFCWEISAIRKGYQGKRLEVFKEPQTKIAEAGR